MARKRKRPAKHSRFRDEVVGFVFVAVAVFFAVALLSYRADDPNGFDLAADGPPRNLGGRVGATLAAVCFQLLGIGAYAAVLLLALSGWNRLARRKIEALGTKMLGLLLLVAAVCALASMGVGELRLGGGRLAAGGVAGDLVAAALGTAFGPVGAPLVALTVALVALIAVVRLSLGRLVGSAWRGTKEVLRRSRTALARRREQARKARQRRAVVDRYARREDKPAARDPGAPILKVRVPVTVPEDLEPAAPEVPHPEPEPVIAALVPEEPAPLPFEQPAGPHGTYAVPESHLLEPAAEEEAVDESELMEKARSIAKKGGEFNVNGEIVAIHPGPVVTTYEFKPAAGVKYSRIINLEDDLSLALKAESIRIARLPGKSTVGIEAPNSSRQVIRLRELIESKEFRGSRSKLTLALGKQIHGEMTVTDLAKMPHLLIAGTTGSGKSVALNCMLLSLLYEATPDEVKLVLVDPKRLEFGLYEDIPHLLAPVVVDAERAAYALSWAVREMDRRYRLLAEYGVRNIEQFNLMLRRGEEELHATDEPHDLKPLPYIVVIIDELADLMIFASAVVETAITRLSQMARAVGIHLIIATQRPSVDVITGTIKNNLPARISFRVASKVDSRVILDTHGAEKLLGRGDMLFLAPGTSRLLRVHGAYVDEDEVKRVVDFWHRQARPSYEKEVTKPPPEEPAKEVEGPPEDRDEYYVDAVRLVISAGEASISNIQRKLRLGYARAGRIVDMMEEEGIVGPPDGSKPRRLLVDASYLERFDPTAVSSGR